MPGSDGSGIASVQGPTYSLRRSAATVFLLACFLEVPVLYAVLINLGLLSASFYVQDYAWIHLGADVAVFGAAYLVGSRFEFMRDHVMLWIVAFAGTLLAGGFPVQLADALYQYLSPGYTFGFELENAFTSFVTAFELSAIPIAGVALAYFSKNRFETLGGSPEAHDGIHKTGFAALAFVFVTLAFVFAGLVDVLRVGVATSDQLAFLRPAYSPFGAVSFDLFFPALFAVAFYMMGRKLKRAMGRARFVLGVSLAGFLGSLVGGIIEVSLLGEPLPLASLGVFVGSAELGILVLALGTATALIGYMRSPTPGR